MADESATDDVFVDVIGDESSDVGEQRVDVELQSITAEDRQIEVTESANDKAAGDGDLNAVNAVLE